MKKWFLKGDKYDYREIAKNYGLNPLIVKLLMNREIKHTEMMNFLNPTFENSVHNPFLMKDMDLAVDILLEAIENSSHILVVGDYDQDGNSATMTLLDGIMIYNDNISYAIPHRVEDGYGISRRIVEKAIIDNVELIITCDNGIAAFETIEFAKENNIKVIVTDHHQVEKIGGVDRLPNADAILNPHRQDCKYPFKELCGAGVSFKLIQALYEKLDGDKEYLLDLLEYVAMGTVCDVVDLVNENRYFVTEGLKRINNTQNYGLQCLIKETGLKTKVNTYALGYIIGPCINAAGRLDTATLGIELFLEENMEEVEKIAKKLVSLNNERKELTNNGLDLVVNKIEKNKLFQDSIIIVKEETIHESLAGIIAGRIKEKYNKPAIVFTTSTNKDILKGSGRSIEAYNIYDEINLLNNLLVSYGGHSMAAGLSIEKNNLDKFREAINKNSKLTEEDFIGKIFIDIQLKSDEIGFDLINEIGRLEPYGKGNSKSIFGDKDILVEEYNIIGKNKNALKFKLNIRNKKMEGIYFGDVEVVNDYLNTKFSNSNKNTIDIIFYPEINEYNGNKNIQLVIKELR